MNVETISHYIDAYGYIIIFLFLFLGIVGIPAPEESLLFLMGVLIVNKQLSFELAIVSAILGTFTGMLTAYFCGKHLGNPFINRYGKYVGITNERMGNVKRKYSNNIYKTIILGFYMPGIRQISPYFAGTTKVLFSKYAALSLLGSILWVLPFVLAGYYSGKVFHINPSYVPYIGLLFLVIFLAVVSANYIRKKRKQKISPDR